MADDPAASPLELVDTWGGPVVPQFPYDVALLDDGRFAVADLGLSQIHIFSADGSLDTSWEAFEPSREGGFGRFATNLVATGNESLYVASGLRPGLRRFDPSGSQLAEHVFEEPYPALNDQTVGPDGRIYLVVGGWADPRPSHDAPFGVLVFDTDLNLLATWQAPDGVAPIALAFDPEGAANVLLADTSNDASEADRIQPARIARIDPDGYAPEVWDAPLELPVDGQFDALSITGDGRYILVEESSLRTVDSDVTAVHVISPYGGDAVRWELPERSAVGLTWSTGLALTEAGTLLITDPSNSRVLEVSPEGEILRAIEDERPARFASPGDIAIGPDGNVYVPDSTLEIVQVFSPDGELLEAFTFDLQFAGPFSGLPDIAIDGEGSVYIVYGGGPPHNGFLRITPDGRDGPVEVDVVQDVESHFIFNPGSVAIGPDGLIYIGMFRQPQLRAYTTAGETVQQWPADPDSINEVSNVATGPDGIYATVSLQFDGRWVYEIRRVDESEETLATFQADQEAEPPVDAIDAFPWDFAIDSDGSFYVLDPFSEIVLRLSPDGRETGRWEVGGDTERAALDRC